MQRSQSFDANIPYWSTYKYRSDVRVVCTLCQKKLFVISTQTFLCCSTEFLKNKVRIHNMRSAPKNSKIAPFSELVSRVPFWVFSFGNPTYLFFYPSTRKWNRKCVQVLWHNCTMFLNMTSNQFKTFSFTSILSFCKKKHLQRDERLIFTRKAHRKLLQERWTNFSSSKNIIRHQKNPSWEFHFFTCVININ